MASAQNASPKLGEIRYVGDGQHSAIFTFYYNGVRFEVVAANPGDHVSGESLVPSSSEYAFAESVEGKTLQIIDALSPYCHNPSIDDERKHLEEGLADLAATVCLPTMRQLAPNPIPDTETLEQSHYPPTHKLQVITAFGYGEQTLICRKLGRYSRVPERHPPAPEDWLRAMGVDLATTNSGC
jgi:hypothetical protein